MVLWIFVIPLIIGVGLVGKGIYNDIKEKTFLGITRPASTKTDSTTPDPTSSSNIIDTLISGILTIIMNFINWFFQFLQKIVIVILVTVVVFFVIKQLSKFIRGQRNPKTKRSSS